MYRPNVIFSNATLADMAARQPITEFELLTVRGVGEAKARGTATLFLMRSRIICVINHNAALVRKHGIMYSINRTSRQERMSPMEKAKVYFADFRTTLTETSSRSSPA